MDMTSIIKNSIYCEINELQSDSKDAILDNYDCIL